MQPKTLRHPLSVLRILGVAAALSGNQSLAGDFSVVPYDPSTMNFPVTPAAAEAVARNWAGNPSLQLHLDGIWADPDQLLASYYQYVSPEGEQFRVHCYSEHVQIWVHLPLQQAHGDRAYPRQDPEPPRLPVSQIRQIALDFAQAHYPDFAALNLQMRLPQMEGGSYVGRLANGAWFFGNQVSVTVDPWTGEVYRYSARHSGPLRIGLQPSLSAAQAEAVALATFNGDPHAASRMTRAPSELNAYTDGLGQQSLGWYVYVVTSKDPGLTLPQFVAEPDLGLYWDLIIDGFSGAVIYRDQWLGKPPDRKAPPGWKPRSAGRSSGPAPVAPPRLLVAGRATAGLAAPPLVRGGTAYCYLGYAKTLYGFSVSRSGADVVLKRRDQTFRVRSGRPALDENGRTAPVRPAPIEIRGRTFLPLGIWERLTGGKCTWSARENVVRFERL